MTRFRANPFVLAALLGATACSHEPTEPLLAPNRGFWAGELRGTATADGIEVSNNTDSPRPYFLFAIERVTATYTDWVPCTGGPACPSVMPGGRLSLPWASVAGYDPLRHEYILSSWQVGRAADGSPAITNMKSVVVTR